MATPGILGVYKDQSIQYGHKHHLDFGSLKDVPEEYSWDPPETQEYCPGHREVCVPVIDLEAPNARELIGRACKTWGAFQVINHGVPQRVLDGVEREQMRLFSLPSHQKLKAARTPDGVTGYGPARISSFFPKLLWSEGFTIFGSPVEHARQLWPHDYKTFW